MTDNSSRFRCQHASCQLPAIEMLTRLLMNSDMKIGATVIMSTRLCQEKMYL
jgi:hypothetical protein